MHEFRAVPNTGSGLSSVPGEPEAEMGGPGEMAFLLALFLLLGFEEEQPTSGVLTSPNYPEAYPNNLQFVQKIQVPEGNTIWIRFTDFECERLADVVWIYTDMNNGTRLGYNTRPDFSEFDWRK